MVIVVVVVVGLRPVAVDTILLLSTLMPGVNGETIMNLRHMNKSFPLRTMASWKRPAHFLPALDISVQDQGSKIRWEDVPNSVPMQTPPIIWFPNYEHPFKEAKCHTELFLNYPRSDTHTCQMRFGPCFVWRVCSFISMEQL